jgi:tryptophanyl-tRNA synthetase
VNLYIEITDDEKFLFGKKDYEVIQNIADENILDIIAVGFNPNKTFIFKDSEYIKQMYPNALKVAKKIIFSNTRGVFGFNEQTNIGMVFFPAIQNVPTMFEKKRCLIPCAIDQDPYWRIQRDVAEKLGYYKAAAIHTRFLPPLTGITGKMSASIKETAVYLSDDEKTVKKKIIKYAFSGGRSTIEEHRRLGGNPDVDVSFQWLNILFELDDKKIKKIHDDYVSGKLLTGELKEILIEKINNFLKKHRKNKKNAEKIVDKFKYKGKLAKKMWS